MTSEKYNIGVVLLAVPGFDRKIRLFDPVGCDVAIQTEIEPVRGINSISIISPELVEDASKSPLLILPETPKNSL